MRIAIANAKGGVAKTTTAIYLASVFAKWGEPAVVYDADPQASASLWASGATEQHDPLQFDVLPANSVTLSKLAGREPDPDEWSIIDAPPQGPTLDAAIQAADFVIVPASDSPIDLQQAWDTLAMVLRTTPAALLLVKAEQSTRAFHETREALEGQSTPRFETVVPKSQSVKKALGTNPKNLGLYRDLAFELKQLAKEGE